MSSRIAQLLSGAGVQLAVARLDLAAGLPARAGVGLKFRHFRDVLEARPDIGFFEVHAENYMVDGGPFHHYLGRIREHYPLSLHGVGLSIGAPEFDPAAVLSLLAHHGALTSIDMPRRLAS